MILRMTNLKLSCIVVLSFISATILECNSDQDWAVEINGGDNIARKVAEENQLDYMGKVGNLNNIYHFRERKKSKKRTKRSLTSKTDLLNKNQHVSWVEHQKDLVRHKRNVVMKETRNDIEQRKVDEEIKGMFNDPEWINEWYLYDARNTRTSVKEDLHVIPVWKMNITGRGVKVSIIDDGLMYTHPDLIKNYDPSASYDINDDDNDPFPNLAPGTSNEHGTRCASEIAMTANNNICGVGIAYNAKVGGIRILDGVINDALEAKAIGFKNEYIDIYSASWGPSDDGKSMEMPGPLVKKALYEGVTKGRNGKGSLYVWAAGNGGYYNDSCGCDGYVSSMYVFSINSISPGATAPSFIERCSSTIASTFSASSSSSSKLVAADVNGKCTHHHTGTSASAPYAAGIFALALEANPSLTWRDFKHLLSWTCQISSLRSKMLWKLNAAGFWVNEYFGFGEIDAASLVKNAINWKTVPPMTSCTINSNIISTIATNHSNTVAFDGTPCYLKVKFIEHIKVKMSFQYSNRGAVSIELRSPYGMNTTLLPERYLDTSNDRMNGWSFVTIHNWGEDPRGTWSVHTEDKNKDRKKNRTGMIYKMSIRFYGTLTMPYHIKMAPDNRRIYNDNYNHVKNDKRKFNENSL